MIQKHYAVVEKSKPILCEFICSKELSQYTVFSMAPKVWKKYVKTYYGQ